MSYQIDEKRIIYADLDPTEGIVLNLETRNYYRLNETGQLVWQGLSGGKNPAEIAQNLYEKFETTLETAQTDVSELLQNLQQEHLIETSSSDSPSFSVEAAREGKKKSS